MKTYTVKYIDNGKQVERTITTVLSVAKVRKHLADKSYTEIEVFIK